MQVTTSPTLNCPIATPTQYPKAISGIPHFVWAKSLMGQNGGMKLAFCGFLDAAKANPRCHPICAPFISTCIQFAWSHDLNMCKQELVALVDLALGQLRPKTKIITQRYWEMLDAEGRAALKSWATGEFSQLEGVPGSGVSKFLPTGDLDEVSRRMAMLQEVLKAIETAA